MDRGWNTALSVQEFIDLKSKVEEESKEKEFKVDSRRKIIKKLKKEHAIAGNDQAIKLPYDGPVTQALDGLNFCILSDGLEPEKKSKAELEQIVKVNGGKIFQSPTAASDIICIADRKLVRVASLIKAGNINIVRPSWLIHCIKQAKEDAGKPRLLLPLEPIHMFYTTDTSTCNISNSVDQLGDSYSRTVTTQELSSIFGNMLNTHNIANNEFIHQLEFHDESIRALRGWLFRGCKVYIGRSQASQSLAVETGSIGDLELKLASNLIWFAGGTLSTELRDQDITHVVVCPEMEGLKEIRSMMAQRERLPRIVSTEWVKDSWQERTLLDEERYAPGG
jgi:DNA ligase-4